MNKFNAKEEHTPTFKREVSYCALALVGRDLCVGNDDEVDEFTTESEALEELNSELKLP